MGLNKLQSGGNDKKRQDNPKKNLAPFKEKFQHTLSQYWLIEAQKGSGILGSQYLFSL